MPIKTGSAKAKGRNLQKHIASKIVETFPTLEADDAVSNPMGSGGVDIRLSPLAQRTFPVSVEAKSWRAAPGMAAIRQSEYNKYPNTVAVVVWKPHRESPEDSLVMLKFTDFLKIMKDLYEAKK
jgi:hypothetical protein